MLAPFIVGYAMAAVLLVLSAVLRNGEFAIYAAIAGVLFFFLHKTHKYVGYHVLPLWGMNVWLLLHIAGGLIPVGDGALYAAVLIPLIGEPYLILKFDQLMHVYTYFIIAMLVFGVVKKLSDKKAAFSGMAFITVLAAAGVGSLNEVIEFAAVVIVADTGVGGYINNAIDLVANLLGALLAVPFFRKLH